MFKVLALLACVAAASAQSGADSAAASGAVCDEPRSWKIMSDINNKGVMCDNVVYNPTEYRCCGKTLRRLASNIVSVPSSLDGNIGQASDSQFCYGKMHVSSRELVCGGEIVSAGTWDTYGRRTEWVACCRGITYVEKTVTYKDADGSTTDITAATTKACCAGTPTDTKADQTTGSATLVCCGATAVDPTLKECCTSALDVVGAKGVAFDKDVTKRCCGAAYVTTDIKKQCCGDVYESVFDDNGNTLGACCEANYAVLGTWGLIADIASKATAPEKDSTDAVWTVNKVCGCSNQWVDVSAGFIEPQTEVSFTNQFVCANGKDVVGPCADALTGFQAVSAKVGCCDGEHFLTANADCLGVYDEKKIIALGMGEEVTDTGSNERGTYLRKNFIGNLYKNSPVENLLSKHIYNENSEVFDVYCGKSSAATAVASVFAAVCAFLAL